MSSLRDLTQFDKLTSELAKDPLKYAAQAEKHDWAIHLNIDLAATAKRFESIPHSTSNYGLDNLNQLYDMYRRVDQGLPPLDTATERPKTLVLNGLEIKYAKPVGVPESDSEVTESEVESEQQPDSPRRQSECDPDILRRQSVQPLPQPQLIDLHEPMPPSEPPHTPQKTFVSGERQQPQHFKPTMTSTGAASSEPPPTGTASKSVDRNSNHSPHHTKPHTSPPKLLDSEAPPEHYPDLEQHPTIEDALRLDATHPQPTSNTPQPASNTPANPPIDNTTPPVPPPTPQPISTPPRPSAAITHNMRMSMPARFHTHHPFARLVRHAPRNSIVSMPALAEADTQSQGGMSAIHFRESRAEGHKVVPLEGLQNEDSMRTGEPAYADLVRRDAMRMSVQQGLNARDVAGSHVGNGFDGTGSQVANAVEGVGSHVGNAMNADGSQVGNQMDGAGSQVGSRLDWADSQVRNAMDGAGSQIRNAMDGTGSLVRNAMDGAAVQVGLAQQPECKSIVPYEDDDEDEDSNITGSGRDITNSVQTGNRLYKLAFDYPSTMSPASRRASRLSGVSFATPRRCSINIGLQTQSKKDDMVPNPSQLREARRRSSMGLLDRRQSIADVSDHLGFVDALRAPNGVFECVVEGRTFQLVVEESPEAEEGMKGVQCTPADIDADMDILFAPLFIEPEPAVERKRKVDVAIQFTGVEDSPEQRDSSQGSGSHDAGTQSIAANSDREEPTKKLDFSQVEMQQEANLSERVGNQDEPTSDEVTGPSADGDIQPPQDSESSSPKCSRCAALKKNGRQSLFAEKVDSETQEGSRSRTLRVSQKNISKRVSMKSNKSNRFSRTQTEKTRSHTKSVRSSRTSKRQSRRKISPPADNERSFPQDPEDGNSAMKSGVELEDEAGALNPGIALEDDTRRDRKSVPVVVVVEPGDDDILVEAVDESEGEVVEVSEPCGEENTLEGIYMKDDEIPLSHENEELGEDILENENDDGGDAIDLLSDDDRDHDISLECNEDDLLPLNKETESEVHPHQVYDSDDGDFGEDADDTVPVEASEGIADGGTLDDVAHVLGFDHGEDPESRTTVLISGGVDIKPEEAARNSAVKAAKKSGKRKRQAQTRKESRKARKLTPNTRRETRSKRERKRLGLSNLPVPSEAVLSDDPDCEEDQPRRSKRRKFPPLQYWKNEKKIYERRRSQLLPTVSQVVVAVDANSEDESEMSFEALKARKVVASRR